MYRDRTVVSGQGPRDADQGLRIAAVAASLAGLGLHFALIAFLFAVSVSCAAQKNLNKDYYHEDLYQLRPKFEEQPVDTFKVVAQRKKGEVVPNRTVNEKVD